MKKKKLITGILIGALACAAVVAGGCNKDKPEGGTSEQPAVIDLNPGGGNAVVTPDPSVANETVTFEEDDDDLPEGLKIEDCYRSELTNLWTDKAIQNQRPIAVMVDNEITALDHFGLNQADIVYELMNSTANGRVTRLMAIVKDWRNLEQFGSIRSTRPTNVILSGEYNAILVHDGGPFYINEYIAKPYCNHLSGGFARFSNGKAMEFTEYVTSDTYTNPTTGRSYDGLIQRIEAAGLSKEYNSYYPGAHFTFNDTSSGLHDHGGDADATDIYLPHPHNHSELHYNAETREYEYKEYNMDHIDPLDNNKVMSFDNVILQCVGYVTYDPNGYMIYDVVNESTGYYFTKGKCINIRWSKSSETALTKFIDVETGSELKLNTGKTYISLIPNDVWEDVKFE